MSIQPITRVEPPWNHLHKDCPNGNISLKHAEDSEHDSEPPVTGRDLTAIADSALLVEFRRQAAAWYPGTIAARRTARNTVLTCSACGEDFWQSDIKRELVLQGRHGCSVDIDSEDEYADICPECGAKNSF